MGRRNNLKWKRVNEEGDRKTKRRKAIKKRQKTESISCRKEGT